MRKLSKSKHYESHNQVTPWLQANNSNRSEFDQVHFRSISLLNPSTKDYKHHRQIQTRHQKRILNNSKSSIEKERRLSLCGKTLSTIKDYYRKNYTEEVESFIEGNKPLNQKKIKQNNLKLLANFHQQISVKKTSIIDLTKSLNDNIKSNNIKIVIQKDQNSRDQTFNRILKIKQEMIRNKQRRKIDKKQMEVVEQQLRPQSKSLPLRSKSAKKSSTKVFFPNKHFGTLVSDFLQKV